MFLLNKSIFIFAFTVLLFINNVYTEPTTIPADNDYTTPMSADDDYTTTSVAANGDDDTTTLVSADNDDTTTQPNNEPTRSSRIIGGEPDRYDEVKYGVVIHDGYQGFCGDSIIGARFILTAAHCVMGHDDLPTHNPLYILIGGTNRLLSDFRDRVPKVEKIFVPSSFIGSRGASQFGYIAVLRLDRPIRFLTDTRIAKVNLPVKLPDAYWDTYEMISGFGADGIVMRPIDGDNKVKISEKFYPGNLRIGRAEVLPQSDCEDIFSGFINIHMAQMCAHMLGNDHRGICTGDEGNGLVWNNTVIAVTSFGNELCNEKAGHASTVYTRVARYMHFIEMAMANVPSADLRVHYMSRTP